MLKIFFVGAARIATIIVIAIVALSTVGWGVYEFIQARESSSNAPLAKPKNWPPITLEPLGGIELNLSTAWRQGDYMYYQFRVKGFPQELASVPASDTNTWTLTFLDEHGFKVFDHAGKLNEMSKNVDDSGKRIGLSSNSYTYVSNENYRLATRWEVTWNFLDPLPEQSSNPRVSPSQMTPAQVEFLKEVQAKKAPRPVPRPWNPPPKRAPQGGSQAYAPATLATPSPIVDWRNVTLWRQLARGMSQDRVREILGEPGKIDQFITSAWWYWGYPSGGQVRFDSSGRVEGWDEP